MCCSSKSVEVIDSSSRYPQQHGNFKKSNIELSSQNTINNNNIPKTSSQQKTLLIKGEKASQKEDYSEAIKTYKETISNYPNDDSAYFKLGQIYLKLKLFSDALEVFTKSVEINKTNPSLYLNKGLCEFNLRK